ncbi:hypothetical protein LEN26_019317 [Aphanomyces euteiches]|nr:hypothetical protein LEN26_019317 [Aphanomyces euteiches]
MRFLAPLSVTACIAFAHDFSQDSPVMQALAHGDADYAVSDNVYSRALEAAEFAAVAAKKKGSRRRGAGKKSRVLGKKRSGFKKSKKHVVAEASSEGGEVKADFMGIGSAIGGKIGRFFGRRAGTKAGSYIGSKAGTAIGTSVAGPPGGYVSDKVGGSVGGTVGGYVGEKVGGKVGSYGGGKFMDRAKSWVRRKFTGGRRRRLQLTA